MQQQLANPARLGGGNVTHGLLQAAADDCPEAVIIANHAAQIVMVNGAAARLLGTSTRELQKLTVWDITHLSLQSDFDVLWKAFLRSGRQHGTYAVRHQDGSIVEVAYCAQANVLPDRNLIIMRKLAL